MNQKSDKLDLPMDGGIHTNKVRVVDENGTTIMNTVDAIALAKSQGKNLVQIAFNKDVYPGAVCKIIDYSKFKYEQKKKQKEQQKRNRANKVDLKEVDFTIRIDDADKATKIRHAKDFIAAGDMVKIVIVLMKKEMNHLDYAKAMMKSILEEFDGIAKIDGTPAFESRKISCTLKKI